MIFYHSVYLSDFPYYTSLFIHLGKNLSKKSHKNIWRNQKNIIPLQPQTKKMMHS